MTRLRIEATQKDLGGDASRRQPDALVDSSMLEPGGRCETWVWAKFNMLNISDPSILIMISSWKIDLYMHLNPTTGAGEIQVAEADGRFIAGSPSPPPSVDKSGSVTPRPPRRMWKLRPSLFFGGEAEGTTVKRQRVLGTVRSPAPTPAPPTPATSELAVKPKAVVSTGAAANSGKYDNVYHQIFDCTKTGMIIHQICECMILYYTVTA